MTAHAMTGDRERCLEAGMDAYVSKPLRPDELLATVDAVVTSAVSPEAEPETFDAVSGDQVRLPPSRPENASASLAAAFGGGGTPDTTPAQQPPAAGLNEAALVAGFGGNHQVLREVIDIFLVDGPHLLSAVQHAQQAGDEKALAASAHALKGSVGLFVQTGAFETARQLERTARAGDLSGSGPLCASLEADMRELDSALLGLRRRLD
jgi:CheY-like chemotaxis protein